MYVFILKMFKKKKNLWVSIRIYKNKPILKDLKLEDEDGFLSRYEREKIYLKIELKQGFVMSKYLFGIDCDNFINNLTEPLEKHKKRWNRTIFHQTLAKIVIQTNQKEIQKLRKKIEVKKWMKINLTSEK